VIDIRPTIPALLERSAREFGEHAYVVTPTERLTYDQARHRSADVARWLLHQGVGKGTRVGLFFTNGADWIIWWLAVSRIGALAVPLSTMYKPVELAKVLRLADVGLLVAPSQVLNIDIVERFEAALPELAGQRTGQLAMRAAPYLRAVIVVGECDRSWATPFDDHVAKRVPPDVLASVEDEVSPADLAIMVHTSGSTADPKGVLHTHGTLVRQTSTWPTAIRALTGSRESPRILCAMPFFWIGGVLAATGALHEPVTVLVMPRLDAAMALDMIEQTRATGLVGWPAFTQRLRDHPSFANRDLTSVPMLRDGPLDIAMTDVPDGFPVHRTMSETAGGFAFTELDIVDEAGQSVADGTTGELLIRGIGVMAGYNKRERCETFDDAGWYHTGDRVYRRPDDPRLFYVGRTSELIKAAGANVSPLEVEAVVGAHPEVAQCVVVGIDDVERGEAVCAVIVPAAVDFELSAVATHTREHLSDYKVPTRWVMASSAELPTLASGKLNRKALRQMVVDGLLPALKS
jgi:acyl-CoA synthetase (AMP-forming)/AMP-acid ligase II